MQLGVRHGVVYQRSVEANVPGQIVTIFLANTRTHSRPNEELEANCGDDVVGTREELCGVGSRRWEELKLKLEKAILEFLSAQRST